MFASFCTRSSLILGVLTAVALADARGAYNAYLHIDGVRGDSQAEGREAWIDITSLSHGMSRVSEVSGDGAGWSKSEHADVTVQKLVDSASPVLAALCAKASVLPEVTVDLVRQDESAVRFYRVLLKNVSVARVEMQAATTDGVARELVALRFGYVEWTYTEYHAAGAPAGDHITYWNLELNEGGTLSSGDKDPPPEADFRMRASLRLTSDDANSGLLTWSSVAGKHYEIYYAPTLEDGFDTLWATVESAGDGTTSFTVPIVGQMGFFVVKEVDP